MNYQNKLVKQFIKTGPIAIDWMLGNYCNFDCIYCFPGSNEGTHRPPTLDQTLLDNLTYLHHRLRKTEDDVIQWHFSGGEPTLYKDFSQLANFLRNDLPNSYISVVTNGSRTVRWWKENITNFDTVILSYHTSRGDLEHFKEVLKIAYGKVKITLDIILGSQNFDVAVNASKVLSHFLLENNFGNVNLNIKTIRETENNGLFLEMTTDQIDVIKQIKENYQTQRKKTPFQQKYYSHNTDVILNDGSKFVLDGTKDILELKGSWQGYRCFAPNEFIQIYSDGSLGRMSCKQELFLANIYKKDFINKFIKFDNGVICKKDHCGCYGLFESSKTYRNKDE
jgi:MoaA/NifB/PqqE/SkfB family radical SAM enzyme